MSPEIAEIDNKIQALKDQRDAIVNAENYAEFRKATREAAFALTEDRITDQVYVERFKTLVSTASRVLATREHRGETYKGLLFDSL